MSCVEVRERVRDSPLRARSLFTVRAAISSARSSERPCSSWLSLMCSYWRARFVPFLTPAGGILASSSTGTGHRAITRRGQSCTTGAEPIARRQALETTVPIGGDLGEERRDV